MEFIVFYQTFNDTHRNIVNRISRKYGVDEHDVESELGEALIRAYGKATCAVERMKLAYTILEQRVIDIKRKLNRREKYEGEIMVYEAESGNYTEVYEIAVVAPTTTARLINIDEELKKLDQRQLIEELLIKASVETVQSINAYLETNTYREAAKLLGTTHTTVSRRISALAKVYDSQKFGSYYDYITVPTRPIKTA